MPRNRRSRYIQMARNIAAKYNLPPRLFLAMIDVESGWDPAAVSSAGAVGLGQLMPGTARGLGVDPWKPKDNLDGSARYLRDQLKHFGNYRDALRAYNAGPGGAAADPHNGLGYANAVLARRSKFSMNNGKVKTRTNQNTRENVMGSQRSDFQNLARQLFYDDPQFLRFVQGLKLGDKGPTVPVVPGATGKGPVTTTKTNGKYLIPGSTWKGTHVTDGLNWNSGKQTAIDIFADPGTLVGAPEDGRVVRWGSAQGGESLYFLADSGNLYWMGHIENRAPVGTRVKRGEAVASIWKSNLGWDDHLHIDRYFGKNPEQFYK